MLVSRKIVFVLVALVVALSVVIVVYMLWNQMDSGLSKESFMYGGIERTYFLHVPPSYDGRTSVSLVFVLHGVDGTAVDAQIFSGFSTKSDKEGFIVVYPQGINEKWNVGFAGGGMAELNSTIDDVGFVNELISRLEQKYFINEKRVYVAGLSLGAEMAYRLGAELSDKIAAIAPVSGSIGAQDNQSSPVLSICEPSEPVSVIIFHGTADQNIPYNGGYGPINPSGAFFLSVADSVTFWVRCDGCSRNALNETSSDGKVIKSVYGSGANGTEVVLYTIVDGADVWPTTPSATDIIWDFFKNHPKQ